MEKEKCEISEFMESCDDCGFCEAEKDESELPKNKVYSVLITNGKQLPFWSSCFYDRYGMWHLPYGYSGLEISDESILKAGGTVLRRKGLTNEA